jgi:hypothetical protein
MLHDSQPPEPQPGPPPGSMFLSLPVLERLEVLRQLKASLDGSGFNQLPSLDDLAASFLEQRQQGTHPSPPEERIRVMESPEAPSPSPTCEPDPPSPPVRPDDVPVLIRHGVLHEVVKQRLVDDLIRTVILDEQDHQAMLRARVAVRQQPDAPMDGQALQDPMDELRLRIWVETNYNDAMGRWFLKHRHELESWIFSCLRVPDEGLAAELFLQLTDDGADLAVLTGRHGIGKERWTRGVVGPVRVSKVAEPLRQVLAEMAVGAIHPPLAMGDDWVILQLLHRFPAEPDGEWCHDVRWNMFEADLNANADRICRRISSSEAIALEATLAELSWQHQEDEFLLPPAAP